MDKVSEWLNGDPVQRLNGADQNEGFVLFLVHISRDKADKEPQRCWPR